MPTNGQSQETMRSKTTMSISMHRPSIRPDEGRFEIVTEKRQVGGKPRRVRVITFTTTDGHRGESRTFNRREAYENAQAARAKANFAITNRVPVAHEICHKPAPAASVVFVGLAPKLSAIDESTLMAELERRGYAAVPLELAGNLGEVEAIAR